MVARIWQDERKVIICNRPLYCKCVYMLHQLTKSVFNVSLCSVIYVLDKHHLALYFFSLAESHSVKAFLTEELVTSNAFRDPLFNLSYLARSRFCSESIRGFVQMVAENFPYSSEEGALVRVIELICQDTTLETIGIRRCTFLAYELICSLQDDDQNPHHQSLGTRLMQRGEPRSMGMCVPF